MDLQQIQEAIFLDKERPRDVLFQTWLDTYIIGDVYRKMRADIDRDLVPAIEWFSQYCKYKAHLNT